MYRVAQKLDIPAELSKKILSMLANEAEIFVKCERQRNTRMQPFGTK